MKKLPISACLVIHNEDRTLERCLKSFSKLVEEIIIVHDGSCSDNSLKIAKRYGAKIFIGTHKGYPEYHRPFTFKKTTHDWILMPDADEYLSNALQEALPKLIKRNVDIYDLLWPGYDNGNTYNNAYKRILFKKNAIKYFSLLNQNPLPVNNKVKIKQLNYIVHHKKTYNYLDIKIFLKRYQKISTLNALQLLGRQKLTLWNCKSADLEFRNRIRTKFPIIFGIVGSCLYHLTKGFIKSIKNLDIFYLKQGFFTSFYCILVFGKVFWYKLSR